MRDYDLMVPADCCISNTQSENRQALTLMKCYLKADIRNSTRIKLPAHHSKEKRKRER